MKSGLFKPMICGHLIPFLTAWCQCAFGPTWGALAWGADLGQGWTTPLLFAGYYGLVSWAVLSANPALGTLVFGVYGLGRTLPVIVAGMLAQHVEIRALQGFYAERLQFVQMINAVALAFLAGYAVVRWQKM